jgi:predicted enzyme related to lactoylglutathione lyase
MTFGARAADGYKPGVYVVVDDMTRAKHFYTSLFQTDPTVDNGSFVGFRINGALFALFAESAYDHPLIKGNNVVPYIQVDDIESEFARVRELAPRMVHDRIITEGPIRLFMFIDPSGNPIEFFALVNPNQSTHLN